MNRTVREQRLLVMRRDSWLAEWESIRRLSDASAHARGMGKYPVELEGKGTRNDEGSRQVWACSAWWR